MWHCCSYYIKRFTEARAKVLMRLRRAHTGRTPIVHQTEESIIISTSFNRPPNYESHVNDCNAEMIVIISPICMARQKPFFNRITTIMTNSLQDSWLANYKIAFIKNRHKLKEYAPLTIQAHCLELTMIMRDILGTLFPAESKLSAGHGIYRTMVRLFQNVVTITPPHLRRCTAKIQQDGFLNNLYGIP